MSVETGLAEASPHRMIAMLYDGAIEAMQKALHALTTNDIAARGESITKAIRILTEGLKASLDSRGGQITENLSALYDYACARLLHANMKADSAAIQEVIQLISQLRDAWSGIAPKA
jgi:flagellar protein FliS